MRLCHRVSVLLNTVLATAEVRLRSSPTLIGLNVCCTENHVICNGIVASAEYVAYKSQYWHSLMNSCVCLALILADEVNPKCPDPINMAQHVSKDKVLQEIVVLRQFKQGKHRGTFTSFKLF